MDVYSVPVLDLCQIRQDLSVLCMCVSFWSMSVGVAVVIY